MNLKLVEDGADCVFLWFRCLCRSCVTRVSWRFRSVRSTSVSPSTCPLWRWLYSSAACPSRKTRRSWRRAALTSWLAHRDESSPWSETKPSTWRTSSTSFWTSVTRCWSSWVSVWPKSAQSCVELSLWWLKWCLTVRYETWRPGHLQTDPSWEAVHDVQRHPQQRDSARLPQVHAGCE